MNKLKEFCSPKFRVLNSKEGQGESLLLKIDFGVKVTNFIHLNVSIINSYVTFLFQIETDTVSLVEMRIHTHL